MDLALEFLTQHLVDHPLPLYAVLARELGRDHGDPEVGLATGLETGVATVLVGFIHDIKEFW